MSSWRAKAHTKLMSIKDEARRLVLDGRLGEARKLVKDAYPFGMREYTPYKIWCEEVRKAIPGLYPARKESINTGSTPLPMEGA